MIVYLDTSAIARRYIVSESGSERARGLCSPESGNSLVTCDIARVELGSALARRRREGILDVRAVRLIWALFAEHCRHEYRLLAVDRALLSEARRWTATHPVRALDAVHLAAARRAREAGEPGGAPFMFVTGDQRQEAAARERGWATELLA